ncbi:hypothetical protein CC86DRAFT_81930 [Ophiobolus disseminans]|uniref:Uncharacterized protein n=1 Tax=Ophiobolus disseminans TaxID=1469910 RepID=A0A6A6ZNR0_9PLEO|nr:hypothetical protein CC86DRAFT_81930 [Ophiobolus disseminans]
MNRLLKRYFRDPREFRSIQAACGALIVDDFARYLFARQEGCYQYFELYLNRQELLRVRDYLIEEGYSFRGNEVESCTSCTGIDEDGQRRGILINLGKSLAGSLARAFECANTTASFCIISWEKAYCIFPSTTFLTHEAFLVRDVDDRQLEAAKRGE